MAATDTSLFSLNKRIATSFFNLLAVHAKRIASEESHKMAIDMQMILRLRFKLKGEPNSRTPKWDGSSGIKSKGSYKNWSVTSGAGKDTAIYYLTYNDPASEESYVRLLMNGLSGDTGHIWYKSFHGILKSKRNPSFRSKLVMTNGKIFSSQMPQGLEPWLKIKRKELNKNILKRIQKEL